MPHQNQIYPSNPSSQTNYVSTQTEDCILTLLDDCQLVQCAERPRQKHIQQAPTASAGKAAKTGGSLKH